MSPHSNQCYLCVRPGPEGWSELRGAGVGMVVKAQVEVVVVVGWAPEAEAGAAGGLTGLPLHQGWLPELCPHWASAVRGWWDVWVVMM